MRKAMGVIVLLASLWLAGCGSSGDDGGGGVVVTPSPDPPQQIGRKLSGVDFGPYLTGDPNQGSLVKEDDLRAYLAYVAANFTACRTYGALSGLEKIPELAKGMGLKVAAGCWLGRDLDANERELGALIGLCRSGKVDIAIVGSETLERGDLTEVQLLGYLQRVKAAGTGVRVTTADTWNSLVQHPAVIVACDEVWANLYPFWEGVALSEAVTRLQTDYDQLKAVTSGKKIVISESGWPSEGDPRGAAIASPQNQGAYLVAFVDWAERNGLEYYWFEAFDEPWKREPGLVGPHWGLWNKDLHLKPDCRAGFMTMKAR